MNSTTKGGTEIRMGSLHAVYAWLYSYSRLMWL